MTRRGLEMSSFGQLNLCSMFARFVGRAVLALETFREFMAFLAEAPAANRRGHELLTEEMWNDHRFHGARVGFGDDVLSAGHPIWTFSTSTGSAGIGFVTNKKTQRVLLEKFLGLKIATVRKTRAPVAKRSRPHDPQHKVCHDVASLVQLEVKPLGLSCRSQPLCPSMAPCLLVVCLRKYGTTMIMQSLVLPALIWGVVGAIAAAGQLHVYITTSSVGHHMGHRCWAAPSSEDLLGAMALVGLFVVRQGSAFGRWTH